MRGVCRQTVVGRANPPSGADRTHGYTYRKLRDCDGIYRAARTKVVSKHTVGSRVSSQHPLIDAELAYQPKGTTFVSWVM